MLNISADLMEHQFAAFSEAESSMSSIHSSIEKKRTLSKLPSMREFTREAKWEKRRRQIHQQRRKGSLDSRMDCFANNVYEEFDLQSNEEKERCSSSRWSVTDEDFDELRGSIELGFGFSEGEGGHRLCSTLPALDIYFAVNQQFSDSKTSSMSSTPFCSNSLVCPSPRSPYELPMGSAESQMICSPGDDPQDVKSRLRHWAQAVACSVRQCSC